MPKQRIIFICTHNAARSQLAEALMRELLGDRFEVFSAGTEQTQVHPMATRVLAEAGIDSSGQYSKTLDQFAGQRFDFIVTVCDNAAEQCPVFPGNGERIHHAFADPSRVTGEDAHREAFTASREEIKTWLLHRFG